MKTPIGQVLQRAFHQNMVELSGLGTINKLLFHVCVTCACLRHHVIQNT